MHVGRTISCQTHYASAGIQVQCCISVHMCSCHAFNIQRGHRNVQRELRAQASGPESLQPVPIGDQTGWLAGGWLAGACLHCHLLGWLALKSQIWGHRFSNTCLKPLSVPISAFKASARSVFRCISCGSSPIHAHGQETMGWKCSAHAALLVLSETCFRLNCCRGGFYFVAFLVSTN